ncbi:hypothetical protein JCM17844_06130 [Iodidimonas gelatinilytica]|uniref:Uncharacterized protein n=1 Tax=Iodidimonas gelatinilytica TaxID=1236966 RepID=A0A5A7MYN6_9PROT|nr:hypothetical protein [Iodidimonas gelatinilytica]GEQ96976.1 hypothetical protein JCM17844_06130 [Iodidimonas gelatinilytica]GER00474.1 hypothetical protein JCM17845_10970 [Iodidimonas gelatinilytica]
MDVILKGCFCAYGWVSVDMPVYQAGLLLSIFLSEGKPQRINALLLRFYAVRLD